jgi:hypothetical protein
MVGIPKRKYAKSELINISSICPSGEEKIIKNVMPARNKRESEQ